MTDNRTNEMRQEAAARLHEMFPGYMWQHYLDAVDALDVVAAGGQLSGISGQFTEAQVEAAAKVIAGATEGDAFYEYPYAEWRRDEFRVKARAALVAAQGAAPQAAALPETGNELRDEDGDLISSGKHLRILQQGMYVCDTCINTLGLNVRWDHAVLRETHTPLPVEGEGSDA